ncbi:unnamed protein product [Rhizophagus irregularis]|nr:unnamed protein product [Rhizophagus irregularis]
MIELKRNGCRNPFVKISDSINSIRKQGDPYNARQLCHFWRNYLDPDVCQENLDDKEKNILMIGFHSIKVKMEELSKKGTNNDIVIPSPPETIDISIPTTPTTHSYLFSQYQPQNREPLPNISYIFNYYHNDSLALPRLLHYQQNLSALPTLYPSLIQEPKLPELPPNI